MKKSKGIFLCSFFVVLIYIVGILIFLLPEYPFSEIENRTLASFPMFDTETFFSGEYTRSIGKFYADRFPGRNLFLRLKSLAELSALKGQNGNVFFGKEQYLIKRLENDDLSWVSKNREAVEKIAEHLSKNQKPAVILYAPRAIDVLESKLPSLYPPERAGGVWKVLPRSQLCQILREKANRGESVFYKTDHHWTTNGAYYAYEFLGESLGYTPFPQNAFVHETITRDFCGTSASASLFPFVKSDSIVRFRYDGDDNFTVTDLSTGQSRQGFYDNEKLLTADKYASFLGGNFAHLRIEKTDAKERPLLLVIKDSFANCLVPFLARHFDLELIDSRYVRTFDREFLDNIVNSERYAGTLFLWNADTLTSDIGLSRFLTF